MSEETRRADNLVFEMKKLEEKHETVMKEREVQPHSGATVVPFCSRASLTDKLRQICFDSIRGS